jgi:hypothetical protein
MNQNNLLKTLSYGFMNKIIVNRKTIGIVFVTALVICGGLLAGFLQKSYGQDIVLLSKKFAESDRFKTSKIVGEVKNIGNGSATSIEVIANLYDKNGDLLNTENTYTKADTLLPNQKSSFEILDYSEEFEGMDSYNLSLKWTNSSGLEEYVEDAPIYKGVSSKTESKFQQQVIEARDSVREALLGNSNTGEAKMERELFNNMEKDSQERILESLGISSDMVDRK